MAWDVSEQLFPLEGVLVYTFGLMFRLWYGVRCGKECVGSSGKCSEVAPDQVYTKAMSEE